MGPGREVLSGRGLVENQRGSRCAKLISQNHKPRTRKNRRADDVRGAYQHAALYSVHALPHTLSHINSLTYQGPSVIGGICIHKCIYICRGIYVYIHIHMYVLIYVCMYIYIYTYISIYVYMDV